MKRPGTKKQRALAILGAALIGSAFVAPSAHAQSTDQTSVAITAGNLTLSAITVGDFAGKSVTGTAQTTNADIADYSVSDLRGGLGDGWQLTAQASQFTDGTNSLPANSLVMLPPVATPGADNLAVPPVVTATPSILDAAAPSAIATAIAGTGTGDWTFTNAPSSLTLSIPANVVPSTYTSTVTMTLGAAPAV